MLRPHFLLFFSDYQRIEINSPIVILPKSQNIYSDCIVISYMAFLTSL